jgi:hypothetical protein
MRTIYSCWYESLLPGDVTFFIDYPYVLVWNKKVYTGFGTREASKKKNKLMFNGGGKVMTACQAFKLKMNISQENNWRTIPGSWPYRKHVLPEEPLIFHYKEHKVTRKNPYNEPKIPKKQK